MMHRPKVSSITYVKNGEEYIERCVRSIMNQTLQDIEIIIVDGGSTDKTLAIIHSLAQKDDRIKLLENTNGVGAQFNMGLKYSNGEFIGICEGDDFILPDKYEKQYAIAKSNNIDVLRACYYLYFDYKGVEYKYKVQVASTFQYNRVIKSEENGNTFLSQFVNGYWNGLYSREFLVSNNILQNETPGASYQDITFSFMTQLLAKRIWFMEDGYHCYRINNPGSSVNSAKSRELLSREYSLLRNQLEERNKWEETKQIFFVWEISSYIQFGDRCPTGEKTNYVEKVYQSLKEQKIDYDIAGINIYHKTQKVLDAFYKGKKAFFKAMTKKDIQNQQMFVFFEKEEFKNCESIILFGAGHFGEIVLDFLILCGKTPIVLDNSFGKQLNGIKGRYVYDPDEYIIGENIPIILANAENALEMYYQLIDLGVTASQIIVCDSEDLFIREIYMKHTSYFK